MPKNRLISKVLVGFRIIKSSGVRQFLVKVLKRIGHKENYLLTVCSTNQSAEEAVKESVKKGYSLKRIDCDSSDVTINDLSCFFDNEYFLEQYPTNSTPSLRQEFVRQRLNDGEVCFVIKHKDVIAYMSWLGFEKTSKYNETGKPVLEHDYMKAALSYNTYCDPLHRGKHLQIVCSHHKFEYLRSKKYCQMFSFIGANNSASIKNLASFGYFKGLLIVRNYIFFKKREFITIKFPKFL